MVTMRSQTAKEFILRAVLVAMVSTTIDSQFEDCKSNLPIDPKLIPTNTSRIYSQHWSCDGNTTLSPVLLISVLPPQQPDSRGVSVGWTESPNNCSFHLRNASVVLFLFWDVVTENATLWTRLNDNLSYPNELQCKECKECSGKYSNCSPTSKDLKQKILDCRLQFDWIKINNSVLNEYYLKPISNNNSTNQTTGSVTPSTLVASTNYMDFREESSPEYDSESTATHPRSNQSTNCQIFISGSSPTDKTLAIGLGVGLGIPLLLTTIINVVLCIKLSRAKSEKRSKSDAYSTISPNSGNSSPNGATQEPQLSSDYSSISPNSTINKSTFNRKTLYAPSSNYDQPYGNSNGNYASIPPANGNTTSPQQKQSAPSVLYAIVNKVKPKRNASKASRTLANPNDDVVIVDNDLYTTDSVVNN